MDTIVSIAGLRQPAIAMKKDESLLLTDDEMAQTRLLGERLARLRLARRVRQADAAVRAGMSRPTARKIEQGDPGRTLGQLLRYLGAIAPGMSLQQLLEGKDPSLLALEASERRRRVRELSDEDRKKLEF
jgi:transcriptional regulator with XRE-family HTH domain